MRCCRPSTASATPSRASRCARCSTPSPTVRARSRRTVEQLYDDQFIETCAGLGRAVHRRPHRLPPAARRRRRRSRRRAPRSRTRSRYRRRKGTAPMLEQLARDVTGWPARAVEFFELLATTQYMNHVRPQAPATADLRDLTRACCGGGGAVRRRRAHGRDAPAGERRGSLQHPERRHLPLAAGSRCG